MAGYGDGGLEGLLGGGKICGVAYEQNFAAQPI